MTIKDFFTRKKIVTPTKTVDDDKKEGYVKTTEHLRILYSADITKWRMAHQSAISTINPSTSSLQDVYEDTLLDTHLKAVLQQRSLNVLNTPFRFLRNGEIDTELTADFQKKWVYDIINEIQNSQYYGYSCLEFHFTTEGVVKSVKSILRHHIIPQLNELLPNVNLQRGVDITKEPFTGTYVLIDHGSLGLLLEASKYTIFKKYATAHWQQLQQLFGVPMRIGRTNSRDKSVIDNIYNTLKNMGTAGFGVMPEGTLVEIIESGKSDPHKIFQEAINVANNELSMRVLGTPNSNQGGSYAKEKVNYERHNDLSYADLRYVQFVFNDQVIPLLNRWSYDLNGVTMEFDPSWSLPLANTQLDVDKWLSEKYDLNADYIQDTYGVKVEKRKDTHEPMHARTVADFVGIAREYERSEKKKESELVNAEMTTTLPNWYEVVIKALYEQKVADGVISQDMYFKTADELWAAVLKEVKSGEQITKATNDVKWLQMQQNNIYAFSAAKSYSEMQALRDLVFDGTKIRPYTEFRADALKIYGTYNENWLLTERDAVVRGTVMGKKWLNIERDKDIYPLLQYITKSDNRVRDEHKALDNKIFKVDNPIWDVIYPPNGWNCRCTVRQLRSGNEDNSDETLKDFKSENDATYWHKNVGKSAILDYMDSGYKLEMPLQNIDDMDAIKNYGLKTIDAIKAKKAYKDVQTDDLSIAEWFDAMYKAQNGQNGTFIIDYDAVAAPVSVSQSFVDFIERNTEFEAFITVEFENIILSANEVWSNSDIDTLTFVKYYNDKVISINVNQDADGLWYAETVDIDNDIVRKGILLMRK